MRSSFAVTSCINKFSFEEKINFEIKVTEFVDVNDDLMYEKCLD